MLVGRAGPALLQVWARLGRAVAPSRASQRAPSVLLSLPPLPLPKSGFWVGGMVYFAVLPFLLSASTPGPCGCCGCAC